MLVLYKTPGCPRCSQVRQALEDLVVAHRVIDVESREDLPEELRDGRLPILLDGEEVFQGSPAIIKHLEELEDFKAIWYKFQSDACYCDEEGNVE